FILLLLLFLTLILVLILTPLLGSGWDVACAQQRPYSQRWLSAIISETAPMRPLCGFSLTLSVALGFAGLAPAKHQLELTDDALPLQELRPMDRRVYILTLDGKWEQPPAADKTYYLNYFCADGVSYSHKVDDVQMFR